MRPRNHAAAKRLSHQHWGTGRAAESQYVLAVTGIMKAAHDAVMKVVEREHLSDPTRTDAAHGGLGGKLLHRIVTWQTPRVVDAFDRLAKTTNAKTLATSQLYGVHVRHVVGVDSAIDAARAKNVALITRATAEFLEQVRQTLEDHENETADEIREALQDRVGVSRSRAALIGRTEAGKLNSQIVQHRARSAGLDSYRWSGSLDERERPTHTELEGRLINWSDPPVTEENGDRNHAGEAPNCRCVPIPFISDLEDEPEAEEPDEELEAAE